MNPIDRFEARPGWHAVEPPEKYRAPDASLVGACPDGCGAYRVPGRMATFGCHDAGKCRCLPRNRKDGQFVFFMEGPATYGNEED